MRRPIAYFSLLLVTLLAACSTPDSRISQYQARFDTLPPDVQQKIRAGQVEVGYTQDMVFMALGEPDRKYTRQTELGATEVWVYMDHTPQISFGVGVGSHGSNGGAAMGVSTTTGGYDPEAKVRVEFRDAHVTVAEYRH
ncbi:MAG TPA: hypothetical protein VFJ90_05280 [Candidatus Didemnitutus sp.]|nr:hypothetical protein [Candidatus Didemnitutus sp.]